MSFDLGNNTIKRRQQSAPRSLETRMAPAALERELGTQE